MAGRMRESVEITPGGTSTGRPGGARDRWARRIVRWLVWSGLGLLVVGLGVGLAAQGPSVAATVVLSAGLLVEAAGLISYRVLFWASVYAKDRPKTARKVRKPGA